jgi:uncharacterized Zn-binding protein involved in type VI secretion
MVTVGATCICVVGSDVVATGDTSVILEGLPVARVNDTTSHGGVILEGSDRIFVNGVPAAYLGGFHACPMVAPGPVPHVGGPIYTSPHMYKWNYPQNEDQVEDMPITVLKDDVAQGSTVLETEGKEIDIGDAIIIGNTPEKVEAAIVIDKGSLVLDRPLKFDHPAGTLITRIPKEYAESVPPLTNEGPESEDINEKKGIPGFSTLEITIGILVSIYAIKKIHN